MTSAPYQLLPPLSSDDYAALEASIVAHGVMVPVEYDEAGHILDGHHRVAICESLGLVDWPRFIRKGLSEDEKRAHARALNLARRHLSTQEKRGVIEAQLKETPSISARAIAARLKVDHKTVTAARARLEETGEIPQTDSVTGRDGVARRRPVKTMFLPDRANVKELKASAKLIRTAEMARSRQVRGALIQAVADKGKRRAGEMPRAAFPILYADPPWEQEAWSDETGQDRGLSYPAMLLDEICALCAGDSSPVTPIGLCALWVTANRLDDGLRVLTAWGFAYVTCMIWDKVTMGMGRWVRDRHEILLIGKRGDFPCPLPGTQEQSLYAEAKGRHSRKPQHFAAMLERLYPDMRKLELFNRADSLEADDIRLQGNWSFWGFEAADADGAEAAEMAGAPA